VEARKVKQTEKERSAWSTSTGMTNQQASGERRFRGDTSDTAHTRPPSCNRTSETLLFSSVPTRVRSENNKLFSQRLTAPSCKYWLHSGLHVGTSRQQALLAHPSGHEAFLPGRSGKQPLHTSQQTGFLSGLHRHGSTTGGAALGVETAASGLTSCPQKASLQLL